MASKWLRRLSDNVEPTFTDLPILSMQTGNTVFLALGSAGLPYGESDLWIRAITALGSYWLGCFLFSKLKYLGASRKITLSFSFFLQGALILVCAALGQTRTVPAFSSTRLGSELTHTFLQREKYNYLVLLPIGLLAFQSGGQIVLSRTLQINEIPVNVLTSLYCDFLSDPALFAFSNVKRNRRLIAIVSYFAGAIGSGWIQRSRAGAFTVLWIAGGLKVVLAIILLLWKSAQTIEKAIKN